MAPALFVALAILVAPLPAHASTEGGADSGAAGAAAGLAGSGPIMQPPDEEDPGGCDCLWPDELPAEGVAGVLALPVVAFAWRRHRRKNR